MTSTHLLWKSIEEHSLEHCLVTTSETGVHIASKIVGKREGLVFDANYEILTNSRWETRSFKIECATSKGTYSLTGKKTVGSWVINGKERKVFSNCLDIDIPLTPFTNTLPINRLKLKAGEEAFVTILYLDVLAGKLSKVRQKYTRLSDKKYKYENVPNDFEAVLTIDKNGFVDHYAGLFKRIA